MFGLTLTIALSVAGAEQSQLEQELGWLVGEWREAGGNENTVDRLTVKWRFAETPRMIRNGFAGVKVLGGTNVLELDPVFHGNARFDEQFWIEMCEFVAYDHQQKRIRKWLFLPRGYGTSFLERQDENTWVGESEYRDFAGTLKSTSKLKLVRESLDKFRFKRIWAWKNDERTTTEDYVFLRQGEFQRHDADVSTPEGNVSAEDLQDVDVEIEESDTGGSPTPEPTPQPSP